MVDWGIHKKWDCKFGIPGDVSDYVAHAIDSKGLNDKQIKMPEDFKEHTEERKLIKSRGGNISIADLRRDLHDRYREKIIQNEDLKYLSNKGIEYVEAYYLHIFLDYLEHQRFWMQCTGESIEVSVEKCHSNKCVTQSGTESALLHVTNFLKNNRQEIQQDLHL